MTRSLRFAYALLAMLLLASASSFALPFLKTDKAQLTKDANAALKSLYRTQPAAKALGDKAAAILVFPKILRAGLGVGASTGDGVLLKKGKAVGYYNTSSASFGMQAGAQQFGYAVFCMTEAELANFENSDGWDIGSAPTVVVVDTGMAKEMNTTTVKAKIYAFICNQEGLIAELALQGQKITKLK